MKKRILSIMLVLTLMTTLIVPASAVEVSNPVDSSAIVSEKETSISEENFKDTNDPENTKGYAEILVTAGGLAVADGPLPIGDLLASGLLTYAAGKLVVEKAPSVWDWIFSAVSSIFISESDLDEGDEIKVKFPSGTNDMDELLGVDGEHDTYAPGDTIPGEVWDALSQ